ncbi:DUF6274 family protein [Streptomyces brasiliensis]|uniref:Uncharacterized protein n=1 Tax=Streptomyces brasiliensis TaxID=1954 RepID=A0A917L5K6_9ACTN|nr:DUF6274 family protein [Streptomyces brasiliensis]GGJ43201.1 hypothetical protein GCM10010121_063050 [Streptomyces brasiliensis]
MAASAFDAAAASAARHETRALLRAHLSAASSYRHLTRHCPICHRLVRLAMASAPLDVQTSDDTDPVDAVDTLEDESPAPA